MLLSILGFIVILCPLVVFHEFGHFIFAKIFGVKAEIFSVGFGPRLFSRKWGETEFRLSAIPLGGYVKLLGEDPGSELTAAEKKRSLNAALPWKRFLIFFGGPLFNFILAAVVFMAVLAIGEPHIGNTVARVVESSYAAKAGFQSGDSVISVQGEQIQKFEQVNSIVAQHPAKTVEFKVLHPGAKSPVLLSVQAQTEQGYSMYGEPRNVGTIDGLEPIPRNNTIGISNPKSVAAKQGIKTGDKWVSLNEVRIDNWETLERVYQSLPKGAEAHAVIKVVEAEKPEKKIAFKKSDTQLASVSDDWGLYSVELFVERTLDKSPASNAGLKAGDRLVRIDEQKVHSFLHLKDVIQATARKTGGRLTMVWERDGKTMTSTLEPTETTVRDPNLKKVSDFTIGVVPMQFLGEPNVIIERIWNPFVLLWEGSARMVDYTYRNLISIWKMVTGNVSVATLGGPILIGKIAGDSLERGLIPFLNNMAILSVGLGILNVLPIPVLDGGHLLLLLIEVIRRRPLSVRQIEIVQQVGLSLIVLLMVVVMRNDLSRLPIFN